MKRVLPIFLTILLACGGGKKHYDVSGDVEPILGEWEGAVLIADIELAMTVTFSMDADTLRASMDIPEQGASGLTLEGIQYDGRLVHFELDSPIGRAFYHGSLAGDKIEGSFRQGLNNGEFYLERTLPQDLPYHTEEVSIEVSGEVTLAGTLSIPQGEGPFPAVILLTGSGPQNRDEYAFGFKPFKLIADHLTRNGVAVLRCDDRGVGESTAGEKIDITSVDFALDAEAQLDYLKTRSEIAEIGILGHSEGATVGCMLTAQRSDPAFLIMMAGSAVPGDELLREQLVLVNKAEGKSDEEIAEQRALQEQIFEAVRSQEGFEELEGTIRKALEAEYDALPRKERGGLGRKKVYLEQATEGQMKMVRSPWFAYMLIYDPRIALAEVTCPVLALYGEKDVQVPARSQSGALTETFSEAGKTNYRIVTFANANHLFQAAETGAVSEYTKLRKEFVPGFLDTLSAWIVRNAE